MRSGNGGTGRSKCSGWVPETSCLLPPDLVSSIIGSGGPVEKSTAARRLGGEASIEFLMQLINSRTLVEEVNENTTTMEPLHYPVSTPFAGDRVAGEDRLKC